MQRRIVLSRVRQYAGSGYGLGYPDRPANTATKEHKGNVINLVGASLENNWTGLIQTNDRNVLFDTGKMDWTSELMLE